MHEKKQQKSGDNSLQIQADTFVLGITEERAREIVDEKLDNVIKEYAHEAQGLAIQRISTFADILIPK